MKTTRYTLRALARLLSYPDQTLREQCPALLQAIEDEAALSSARRQELQQWAQRLLSLDMFELEERYVETFDRGRATSLHLFEHVHGDSRDRGPAMIDLIQTYEQAGLFLGADELPDHLSVVLEFSSIQEPSAAQAFLDEMAHILQSIFSALLKRQSGYAVLLAAVLDLAGHKAQAVELPPEEALDESWAEPQAFDGCSSKGQARPGESQPVHFVRQRSTPRAAA